MNKILLALALLIAAHYTLPAQVSTSEPYQFSAQKRLATTPVKSQDMTGTCWCFSLISFLESELLREGKAEENLSEMFVVRNIYREKCENYVRRQGTAQLGEGGLGHDAIRAARTYGLVPESVYPGRTDPNVPFNQKQFLKDLKALCDELVAQGKQGQLADNWLSRIDEKLDAQFGPLPKTFKVGAQTYTPLSYRDHLGLQFDDYVSFTSFSHHPFWTSFILEVPDNFANGSFYNVPLDDLMRCVNTSISQGYTVEWDADVSNRGFGARQNGLAIVPAVDWKDKTEEQRTSTFKYWEPEKTVTQASRQQAFDRLETTDDHLMHIVGMLDEAHTGTYYVVKNSWGEVSEMKGFVNVSEAYLRLNSVSFVFNKKALPADILRHLGIDPGEAGNSKSTGSAAPDPNNPPPAPPGKAEGKPGQLQFPTLKAKTLPPPRKAPEDAGN